MGAVPVRVSRNRSPCVFVFTPGADSCDYGGAMMESPAMKNLMSACLALALTGCGQPAPQQNAAAPAKPEVDYLGRINALAPKQRDVVFYRALDDAGSDCQSVSNSGPRAPVQGRPAWTAHCEDGRDWVVILQESGMLQIATTDVDGGAAGSNTQ
jgi:hypothetical protein